MRKLHGHLKAVEEAAVARTLPQVQAIHLQPHEKDLETELQEGAQASHCTRLLHPWHYQIL